MNIVVIPLFLDGLVPVVFLWICILCLFTNDQIPLNTLIQWWINGPGDIWLAVPGCCFFFFYYVYIYKIEWPDKVSSLAEWGFNICKMEWHLSGDAAMKI